MMVQDVVVEWMLSSTTTKEKWNVPKEHENTKQQLKR